MPASQHTPVTGGLQRSTLRAVLGWLCLGLWVGLMIVGLWPFNFRTRNQVRWLANPSRVYFDGYGEMYSAASWKPLPTDGWFSVEVWLKARPDYNTYSPILCWLDGPRDRFVLGQSLTDLEIEADFVRHGEDHGSRRTGRQKIYIDQAFRSGQPRLVTVTSGAVGTAIYLDGALARNRTDLTLTADSFSGTLLVGHAPKGNEPWSGELYGIAFYRRLLNAEQVSRHYQAWREGRTQELIEGSRDSALYTFGDPGATVHDQTGVTPDLTVPKRFHLLRTTVLGFPAEINRWEAPDIVVNILGFIPFGFCIAVFVRLGPNCRRGKAFAASVLIGTATSLAIELLQVYLPSRDSSSLDLINNILGTAIGALLPVLFRIPRSVGRLRERT